MDGSGEGVIANTGRLSQLQLEKIVQQVKKERASRTLSPPPPLTLEPHSSLASICSNADSPQLASPRLSTPIAFSDDFLRRMPKTDLHVHLGGSLRISTLIELAKQHKIELPAYTQEELETLVFKRQYDSLEDYLEGFKYTHAVMASREAIERIAYELAEDEFAEGVRYFELRFAPQLQIDPSMDLHDVPDVLQLVNSGLQRARDVWNAKDPGIRMGIAPPYDYGIVVIAMRTFSAHSSGTYYKRLLELHGHEPSRRVRSMAACALVAGAVEARDKLGLPVVGVDIAGAEKGYPAQDFKDAYELAHKNFLKKTVHSGEGFGPESIFQAITDLYADRIGHGFHMFSHDLIKSEKVKDKRKYSDQLVQYIAAHRIGVEVCLTSNLQTMPELKGDLRNHAIRKMLDMRLGITLCTDNRLVSRTSVTREFRLACDTFGLTLKQLREILQNGFKRMFYPKPYNQKRQYVRKCFDYFDMLCVEFGYVKG